MKFSCQIGLVCLCRPHLGNTYVAICFSFIRKHCTCSFSSSICVQSPSLTWLECFQLKWFIAKLFKLQLLLQRYEPVFFCCTLMSLTLVSLGCVLQALSYSHRILALSLVFSTHQYTESNKVPATENSKGCYITSTAVNKFYC